MAIQGLMRGTMATADEKTPEVNHHDEDLHHVDTAVQIAHETEDKKVSPWTGPMLRLYAVLGVAYLCGYVPHNQDTRGFLCWVVTCLLSAP